MAISSLFHNVVISDPKSAKKFVDELIKAEKEKAIIPKSTIKYETLKDFQEIRDFFGIKR